MNLTGPKLFGIVALTLAQIGTPATASRSSITEFQHTTKYHLFLCKTIIQNYFVLSELAKYKRSSQPTKEFAEIKRCIDSGLAEAQTGYQATQTLLSENPAAQNLLKEYFLAWMSGMNNLAPQIGEPQATFDQRVTALEAKITDAWNRFNLEAELQRPAAVPNAKVEVAAPTAKAPASADIAALLESCSAIPNDKKRATCFETVARMNGSAADTKVVQPAQPSVTGVLSDDVVKIGVLTDMSGAYSAFGGKGAVIAAEMAVADFGGKIFGKPVEVVAADHLNKADVAATIARSWFVDDKVDMITELLNSSVGIAVQKIAHKHRRIVINTGTASTVLSNVECTPYSVHYVYDTYALATGLGSAITANGGNSWFFVTADAAFGHALQSDTSRAVLRNGGSVVGSVKHALASNDLTAVLGTALASKAKVVALATAGSDFSNAVKLASLHDMAGQGQILAGLMVLDSDIQSFGLTVAQGLQYVSGFYRDRDDESRAFAKRFFDKAGAMPSMSQAGVYSAVTQYLKAITAARTDNPNKVMAQLKSTTINDAFAKNGKIRADGRMVHDMYLFEVKRPADAKDAWDLAQLKSVIPGDKAFMPLSSSQCPLVK